VKAALAGLDMDQPGDDNYFSEPLKQAVLDGKVPQARLDDMVHRIVRSMFANGVIDQPPVQRSVVDPFSGRDDAQKIEEESIVLLQNSGGILPLSAAKIKRIAVIGGHADVGVLSGGGSAQVDAPGGNAIDPKPGTSPWGKPIYFPSPPLRSIREQAADTKITYDAGTDLAAAAKAASSAQVAIVFVTQWMTEGQDAATLSLPEKQDDLVAAVAAANPNTIVVLETGGPVNMPWAAHVKGIVESWYPGIGGGEAIANILFGRVNPSGKLPVTFAATENDLPHPHVTGLTESTGNNGADAGGGRERVRTRPVEFPVDYNVEGMAVGYRWFQEKNLTPLFPFGFGLSYTRFAYANLKVDADAPNHGMSVSFDLRNTGARAGDEIAEVYVTLPNAAGEPFRKLAGWKRVPLAAAASQAVEVAIDPLYLSIFSIGKSTSESTEKNAWVRPAGEFLIEVGGSSAELPLRQSVRLATR
jgi:beta-glucosidase